MNNFELAVECKKIATNYKTLYVLGGFGAPLTKSYKDRIIKEYSYNDKKCVREANSDTFAFDCIGLIKGILWGWTGNHNAIYGGAEYAANNVPDIGADATIDLCRDVSKDFTNIEIGEAVWRSGHIGIYIGNGLSVESTPAWGNQVQITSISNMGAKSGYPVRLWTKHGKLPWISYFKMGDINFDGYVNAQDVRLALRASVKSEKLTEVQLLAADIDSDGKVTASDAREILKKSVKKV